jgi:redox-sensitive bicupin YhaK (pirin superfamily)
MKKILGVFAAPGAHWVGDGFPVRTLFSYDTLGRHISPFLLFDYAGPHRFDPAARPRGVGEHPHRGFETVTIVYEGEVAHRDSAGHGGVIGPGDVQWMTAAAGVMHEEFHSPAFTQAGGTFRVAQLWVNLPARDKMGAPRYQPILASEIPTVELPGGGRLRVIAGEAEGVKGPADTFTPVNVWDLRLPAGGSAALKLPKGHNGALAVLSGRVKVNGEQPANEAQIVLLSPEGSDLKVEAEAETLALILSGEPIDEPVVGYGPFVMNTEDEIRQAIADVRGGRFGQLADA